MLASTSKSAFIKSTRTQSRCSAGKPLSRLHVQLPSTQQIQDKVLVLGAALAIFSCNTAHAAELTTQQRFNQSCAGCHAGGGNIVQRSAGLFLEDMQRNNAASAEQIYDLIYSGKGKMPGYGQKCAPQGKCTFAARLTDGQITDLTDYVLEKAATGWKQ